MNECSKKEYQMNKHNKLTGRLIAAFQILAMTLLASCTAANASADVCHASGDAAHPYEEIAIDSVELVNQHRGHANDIFPVPVGGCPTLAVETSGGEIILCHATGDLANPYEELALPSAEMEQHLGHPDDINPALLSGCPAYPLVITDGETLFCHATGDAANPYEELMVSVDGLDGHAEHEDDVFPLSRGTGCPTDSTVTDGGKVTICHATSSKKNPYNEITVSVDGLNGHNKHQGDIIPAPAEGCPT
jgi:hypothetical protein